MERGRWVVGMPLRRIATRGWRCVLVVQGRLGGQRRQVHTTGGGNGKAAK